MIENEKINSDDSVEKESTQRSKDTPSGEASLTICEQSAMDSDNPGSKPRVRRSRNPKYRLKSTRQNSASTNEHNTDLPKEVDTSSLDIQSSNIGETRGF
jgi:hypothetical protein